MEDVKWRSLQHRGSSKSPVNEINLSRPICRVGVTRSQVRIRAYAMHATDDISGSPRPPRGTCGPRDTIIWHHLEVHPARPSDKGPPSFSGTWGFDHATRQIDVNTGGKYIGRSNFLDPRAASRRTGRGEGELDAVYS